MRMMWMLTGVCLVLLGQVEADSRVARDDEARKLTVTSIREEPYMMVKNGDFIGFIPDLLDEIMKTDRNLNFEIKLVGDSQYGSLKNGKWTGMMGELTNRNADLAAAAITVSEQRAQYIDFTDPVMDAHLTILIKKPEDGSESPIKSAKDLVDVSGMRYGCVKDGFTFNFFKDSQSGTTFNSMWQHMSSNSDDIVTAQKDGVQRVRDSKGKYAFIMESPTAEFYMKNEPCELDTVGKLNQVKYALAVQKGSALKDDLDRALANLRSTSTIEKLRKKWWSGKCSADANSAHGLVSSLLVLVSQVLLIKVGI